MRLFATILLAQVSMIPMCSPSGPTDSEREITINLTQNIGSQNQTGQEGGSCAGITGTPVIIIDGGTFDGGKAKVREPLLGHIEGLVVPSSCNPQVSVQVSGACNTGDLIAQTLRSIQVNPIFDGTCFIRACVANYTPCASLTIQVIN